MKSHPFSRGDFTDLLGLVANNALQRPTGRTYFMTSDVAWQFPGCAPKENIRLWRDKRGLAAFAWFQPPDSLKYDVRNDLSGSIDLPTDILGWAESRRMSFPTSYPFYIDLESMEDWANAIRNTPSHPLADNKYIVTSALETDEQRMKFLRESGFTATKHFEPILTLKISEIDLGDAPIEFTLRHVEEADYSARVDAHSAAWAPASGFNMEQYLKVRAITEVFDPTLDIVAEAQDGTFASYTIAWHDPVSMIGSFEPFGTRPEHRGKGVSQAVIFEGLRRLSAKGAKFARIYTAGFNQQAASLYKSCGFSQVDVNRTFLKIFE